MSKKSKTASRERRKREKHSRKEANRARYAALRDAGQNRKKKSGNESGRATVRLKRHRNGACGNIGCIRCSEVAQKLAERRAARISGASAPPAPAASAYTPPDLPAAEIH